MQRVDLKADVRAESGKGVARKLRAAGRIPAVLYGGDKPPLPISLIRRDLALIMQGHEGHHLLVDLAVEGQGGESSLAFLQDLAVNPISNLLDHADFRRVDPNKAIRTTTQVHCVGQPAGVRLGGVMQIVTREIEIEARPIDIPELIEADVTRLGLGDALHVRDLVREGMPFTILTPVDRVLVTVMTPRLATAEETAAEAVPVAEGSPPAAATPAKT
jgi:large subunit ribosomal protein L25